MANRYDLIVVGGGPAGAAAAWRAAKDGAKVLIMDRASFPRDKPCGDGVTPRSVKWLCEMGLDEQISRFHRVDRIRTIATAGVVERPWPERPGLPNYGYVIPRTELDHAILQRAAAAGAEVRQAVVAVGPQIERGVVVGVQAMENDRLCSFDAPVCIAADGMSSRFGRAAGLVPRENHLFAIAVRAQVASERSEDSALECYMSLRSEKDLLPGYGWVFPLGNGTINLGVGYMSTYPRWKLVNANHLMRRFVNSLPRDWRLPRVEEMVQSGQLQGWRLPMGLTTWPPWKPGILGVGDAIGTAKPFTGSGISKALQSGVLGAQVAISTLGSGDPCDLSAYQHEIDDLWGAYYRLGRLIAVLLGRPQVMQGLVSTGIRVRQVFDFFMKASLGNGGPEDSKVTNYAIATLTALSRRARSAQSGTSRPSESLDLG